jgi:hypothetical protein
MWATPAPAALPPGHRRPTRRRELVQQANTLASAKVAAMFAFHPVSPLVTRKEVNYPLESCIPDLVDSIS